jgi:hypothetical protein
MFQPLINIKNSLKIKNSYEITESNSLEIISYLNFSPPP